MVAMICLWDENSMVTRNSIFQETGSRKSIVCTLSSWHWNWILMKKANARFQRVIGSRAWNYKIRAGVVRLLPATQNDGRTNVRARAEMVKYSDGWLQDVHSYDKQYSCLRDRS